MMNALEVKNLKKSYGNVVAVDSIDFTVRVGQLYAFLGPNGAGKSTTINMISTLLKKDSGEVIINGYTLDQQDSKIRESIGIVFQDSVLDNELTVLENLELRGSFYSLSKKELKEKIAEISKIVNIDKIMNRRYGKLSGGQRRRVDIARALLHEPQLLILDEPTTGLDPQTRLKVWETIRHLQETKNLTVFMTTHYMEEAANADYVVIIDYGKIVASGTPNDLRAKYSSDVLKLKPKNLLEVSEVLNQQNILFEVKNDVLQIKIKDSFSALDIIQPLKDRLESFEVISGTMDDVFIEITGRLLDKEDEF